MIDDPCETFWVLGGGSGVLPGVISLYYTGAKFYLQFLYLFSLFVAAQK